MKRYDLNDRVLCKHGSYYYEAKITEIAEEDGETVYVVHYQGWHKRYDERIAQSETTDKFLPFTEENIARCKKEIQEAASSSKNKRKKTKESNEDDKLIDMPTCLLQILVDDSDIMTRQRMVSRLPARHTVDSIINDDIITCTQHLIGFLEKNYAKYYSIENDYENTTPEYQKTAWASTS
ncbi:unnamed protein product [Angiostrongylus costaricensis]|uniref:MRG domain-containing protein n=1 Tax=Angiostrongylus costaricensis TaxID=334426 RepID=A0A0R3PAP2_ANGCS|nr:unnamed protein product [Angiostrongylus costaricensis]